LRASRGAPDRPSSLGCPHNGICDGLGGLVRVASNVEPVREADGRNGNAEAGAALALVRFPWRSIWLCWGALVTIDLVSRASYLGPRLATIRGAVNYGMASVALWITLRLLMV